MEEVRTSSWPLFRELFSPTWKGADQTGMRRSLTWCFTLQENDYIDSYFDNGEEDIDDGDDGEATY